MKRDCKCGRLQKLTYKRIGPTHIMQFCATCDCFIKFISKQEFQSNGSTITEHKTTNLF